jgi:sugar O-acyltransferase (sialic acid O-acetyltransferase NeuD family)
MLGSSQKNKSIGFIGFGELAQQIVSMFGLNVETLFVFDDEAKNKGLSNSYTFDSYKNSINKFDFVFGIGYKHLGLKTKIIRELISNKANLPNFIHKSCFVSKSAQIGKGVIAYPLCNIDKEVKLGDGVLLNNSVVISHNSSIGSSCYLSPGVVISGNVSIGESTFVGSGSTIANDISIGKNVIIGAGTVVTSNIPDNSSAIGNPLRILNKPLKLI